MFVPKKMEIIQENTKMMNRYCFSLNNIEIKPCFQHYCVVKTIFYSLRSFVKHCFNHSKIKFISLHRRVISSICNIYIMGGLFHFFTQKGELIGEGDLFERGAK